MQDTKLFETILGITAPWHVARVELKTDDQRVDPRPSFRGRERRRTRRCQ